MSYKNYAHQERIQGGLASYGISTLGPGHQDLNNDKMIKREKYKQLAQFQQEQIHAKRMQQEMERIKQVKQDEADEAERARYKRQLYERHVKEKLDIKEYNRNVYQSVDIHIAQPEEEEVKKDEYVFLERWQLPKQFPSHVEKWIDDSIGREFGDLKINLDLNNRALDSDLKNINQTFSSLQNQNNLLEEKLKQFENVAKQANITEDLRKREIWFNICKTVPKNKQYNNDQGYTDFNYKPNDYYNKKAIKSNEEIYNELDKAINLDHNYINQSNRPFHIQSNSQSFTKNQSVPNFRDNSQFKFKDLQYKQMANNGTYGDQIQKRDKDKLFLHYNYSNLDNVDPLRDKHAYYFDIQEKKNTLNDIAMKKYFEGIKDSAIQEKLDELNRKKEQGIDDAKAQALRDFEDQLNKEKIIDFQKYSQSSKKSQSVQDIYNIDTFIHELDYYKDRYE